MFITEENGAQQWQKMLKENFNVNDSEKLSWVSQYAAIHEAYEAGAGMGPGLGMNGWNNSPAVVPQHTGVGPIYTTPLNTTGMGNPSAPQNPNVGTTMPAAPGNLWNQGVGSGDIPVSTLPMALNVALMTIGLELVPVIPAKGPWTMLSYMDFPYAGGKLGRVNETSFDGKGDGKENKPIYVKVLGDLKGLKELRALKLKEQDVVTVEGNGVTFIGRFRGFGRMDGALLLETVECTRGRDDSLDSDVDKSVEKVPAAITELFVPGKSVDVNGVTLENAKADFVQTSVDLVDGFANFATGRKEAMTRAQNETGTGNVIGLRLFSKWVQMGSYEVTGAVTRQQLQDLPLYGVDGVAKVMEAMQNELTQHINQRILERAFALGVTNAVEQKIFQGVDLNLYLGTTGSEGKDLREFGIATYADMYGNDYVGEKAGAWMVANSEALTSAENTHTRQRRIASRILAAANLIQTVGRRGRANWVVTNAQVASALQDVSGYVVAPMANNLAQDGSQNLFLGGTLAGLKVYVDPYMGWNDCRICVGRKGTGNEPGLVFMPYILADKVSITAEGTMAPKMLLNSRFALVEAGFYPETQYYTFAVYSDFGII